jgi:hypothetical protein
MKAFCRAEEGSCKPAQLCYARRLIKKFLFSYDDPLSTSILSFSTFMDRPNGLSDGGFGGTLRVSTFFA